MEWSTLSYNFSFFQVTLILTWVIDSPISPESWLMSLLFVVIITMIKQGYEDYLRSITFPFHLINMMTKDWPWAGQCVQKVNCLLIFDQLPLKRRPQHLLQLFTPKTNHFILPYIGGDYQACACQKYFSWSDVCFAKAWGVICKSVTWAQKGADKLAPLYANFPWCEWFSDLLIYPVNIGVAFVIVSVFTFYGSTH